MEQPIEPTTPQVDTTHTKHPKTCRSVVSFTVGYIRSLAQMFERRQQLSIMHNVLKIDDIIYAILQHVKSSTMDLINVAMTCSKLSDPALNMLWCEQSSLGPLIMCLPQDTWRTTHGGTIVFCREPLLTEWERVRINAPRIRRLVVYPNHRRFDTPPVPSGPVLQHLFVLFPPALLFPKLCALRFHAVSRLPQFRANFLLHRQFLPELETLTFDVPVDVPKPEVDQLLGALSAEASGLRQLTIMAHHGLSACRFTVPKLPKFNRLFIGAFDVGLMRQNITNIQHSRCLQTLVSSLRGPFNMENLSGDMPLELSTLKQLGLFGTWLQDCTSFLLQVATPRLSAIDIKYRTAAILAEITAFIESLVASCRTSSSLEKIFIVDLSHRQWWEPETDSQLHSRIFRPLLQFKRLSTVNFFNVGIYCLDDAFIKDMAVAWPGLRELKFSLKRLETSDVTFAAVLSLASKCRSLRTLQLTFNATYFSTLPYAPGGNRELWPTQTSLHELHVGHSKVSAASRFHLFLAVLFPNVAHLTWYGSLGLANNTASRELKESWVQLVKHREMFPAIAATWPDALLQPQPQLEEDVG